MMREKFVDFSEIICDFDLSTWSVTSIFRNEEIKKVFDLMKWNSKKKANITSNFSN